MIAIYIIFIIATAWMDAEIYNNGYRFTDHTSRFIQR